jgi:hypothetical protein
MSRIICPRAVLGCAAGLMTCTLILVPPSTAHIGIREKGTRALLDGFHAVLHFRRAVDSNRDPQTHRCHRNEPVALRYERSPFRLIPGGGEVRGW